MQERLGHQAGIQRHTGEDQIVVNQEGLRIEIHTPTFRGNTGHLTHIVGIQGFVITAGRIGQKLHNITTTGSSQQLHTVLIDAGYRAITGSGDGFSLIHFEQIQHHLFIFLTLADQLTIGSRITHILKNHQSLSCP